MKKLFYTMATLLIFIQCQTGNKAIDYDKQYNFSQIKTYNFYSDNKIELNSIDSLNFFKALEDNLQAKNLVKTNEDPDIYVAVKIKNQTENQVNTVNFGIGGGSRWFGLDTGVGVPINKKVKNYTIQIDMDDAHTWNLVWTGETYKTLSYQASSETKNSMFKNTTKELLKKYPPIKRKPRKNNYYN